MLFGCLKYCWDTAKKDLCFVTYSHSLKTDPAHLGTLDVRQVCATIISLLYTAWLVEAVRESWRRLVSCLVDKSQLSKINVGQKAAAAFF